MQGCIPQRFAAACNSISWIDSYRMDGDSRSRAAFGNLLHLKRRPCVGCCSGSRTALLV